MNDDQIPTTAEYMTALLNRLAFGDDLPAPELPVVSGQDTTADLVPRSVKLAADLDRRCKERALSLGLSQSAYIRSLIERDLGGLGWHDRPVMVSDLARLLAELGRTV